MCYARAAAADGTDAQPRRGKHRAISLAARDGNDAPVTVLAPNRTDLPANRQERVDRAPLAAPVDTL